MLKLLELKISNIGRFVGEHNVSFEKRPYLIQVDAQNINTGGSSGSGKSTIFNALEYLLGINELPTTILQSRLTKSPMEVEGVFNYEEKRLVIKRSKSDGLVLSIDGVEIVSGNNKAAEEKLDEILGISRDLLRKMIHKRQKEGGFFLGLTPKECHTFLAEALDLKTWSKRLQEAELDIKKYKQDIETTFAAIESASFSLKSFKESFEKLTEPCLDWDPNILPILQNNLERSKNLLKDENLKLELELGKVESPAPPSPIDRSNLKQINDKIIETKAKESFERQQKQEKWQSLLADTQKMESTLSLYKRTIDQGKLSALKLEEIKAKIILIKNNTCPTCKQTWHKGAEEIDSLIVEAKNKTLDIQNAQNCEKELSSLEVALKEKYAETEQVKASINSSPFSVELQELEFKLKEETLKIDKEQNLLNLAYSKSLELTKEKEKQIRENFAKTIENLSYNVQESNNLFLRKTSEYQSFKTNKELFETNKRSLTKSIEDQEKQLTNLKAKNEEANEMLAVSTEAAKVIKAYMNSLFQGALDNIADKSTKILSRIPNMATSSVYFEGFKEAKNGSIKEEINAILTMDGEIDIPIKSMSGGERTSIDLAIDLAVIDMIEEQAGKGLDLFILDEPFDGLDSVCREECLQILQAHISGKRLVIVDHSNETKELVQDRIIVIRDGQESRIDDSL